MPTPKTDTPPVSPPPPVAWDVIPTVFQTLIHEKGAALPPMIFNMVLGLIYCMRENRAFVPQRHNPKSPEVLETWLKETVLLDGVSLDGMRIRLLNSTRTVIPRSEIPRPAAAPGTSSPTPAAPRPPVASSTFRPGPVPMATPVEDPVVTFQYSVETEVHGTVAFSRVDTVPCEGEIRLSRYAGLSDDVIHANLRMYARENYGNDDLGEREEGDNVYSDEESEDGDVTPHIDAAADIIAAVREFERTHPR